jgi:hypothetical protein
MEAITRLGPCFDRSAERHDPPLLLLAASATRFALSSPLVKLNFLLITLELSTAKEKLCKCLFWQSFPIWHIRSPAPTAFTFLAF